MYLVGISWQPGPIFCIIFNCIFSAHTCTISKAENRAGILFSLLPQLQEPSRHRDVIQGLKVPEPGLSSSQRSVTTPSQPTSANLSPQNEHPTACPLPPVLSAGMNTHWKSGFPSNFSTCNGFTFARCTWTVSLVLH